MTSEGALCAVSAGFAAIVAVSLSLGARWFVSAGVRALRQMRAARDEPHSDYTPVRTRLWGGSVDKRDAP